MEYRVKVAEIEGEKMRFEVHQFLRESHAPLGLAMWDQVSVPVGQQQAAVRVHHAAAVRLKSRQLRIVLDSAGALLEPGALQYARSQGLTIDVIKNDRRGNFLTRKMTQAGTGESAFSTRYTGVGEIWTEPTQKYFLLAKTDGQSAILLDDGAFYACEGTLSLGTHVHRSVQGVLSGAGLMQPKLEGRGVFVVESPVPTEEIEKVDLDGTGSLVVDGDLALMYHASLQVELRPLTRGLRNLRRSGEGLVYVFRGVGSVWLTPTIGIGH